MEALPIIISVIAILLSGFSLFMQFFHRPRRLRVITMPMSMDGRTRFGICNSGKDSVYITGLSVNYRAPWHQGLNQEYPVGVVQWTASIVNPGSILEFSYILKEPPKTFFENVPEKINQNGKPAKTVNVEVYIQFAFPDGKVFSNQFEAGYYEIAEDMKGQGVYGVNLDLLKSALPVLRKVGA